jgi:flagellar basal-body rod modification protein FlgD
MDISGITGIDIRPDEPATVPKGNSKLGKEDFMTLLLKQLSYQDPLDPMDSAEFTTQLTQFSSLEELGNMRQTLEDVLAFQQSMQNAAVTNLIGRSVKVSGDTTQLQGSASLDFELMSNATVAEATIFDASGRSVATVSLGSLPKGEQTHTWNGTDEDGTHLPDGTYTFSVTAQDISGNPVAVQTNSTGTVAGISFQDNITYLMLEDGRKVHLNEIRTVEERRI